MSQHDMNVANGAGAAVRADLNNALVALATLSSGASAPSPSFPSQIWADTGTGRLKRRDSSNASWIDIGPLNSDKPGSLINCRVFSTPGSVTYTPTTGTSFVVVECQGAGGAGGGCVATGAGNGSIGSGGGAGGYAQALYTSGFSGVTVTVGAGGTPVTGGAGGVGGTSSFGGLISCPGGKGGTIAGPSSGGFYAAAGNSNSPSGTTLISVYTGEASDLAICLSSGSSYVGKAGASVFGPGAPPNPADTSATGGFSYGSGGGGTARTPSGGAITGGVGAPGIVRVWEYT
jgi:hypothetical protein